MNGKECCAGCLFAFYAESDGEVELYTCKRNPPALIDPKLYEDPALLERAAAFVQPLVVGDMDWCGEYRPRRK